MTPQTPALATPATVPPTRSDALDRLGRLIAGSDNPDPAQVQTASELMRLLGGHRVDTGIFCAALLDLSDRIGRVPSATWLGLCRGIAVGAAMPGEGTLPLPLRQAANRVITKLDLPMGRRLAMAQALMLDPV
jgi:hypothetical protein